MLRVFIGYDPRQALAYNVLQHSIVSNASVPVSITPLILKQLPIDREGLTQFTYSRFLVPALCDYKGHALFLDADMVVTGDILTLFKDVDRRAAEDNNRRSVCVMKQQPEFEWPSAMLFDNELCTKLSPSYVNDTRNKLFDFAWADYGVGEFAREWNQCVGYMEASDTAKLYHYTQGLPCWVETAGLPEDTHWHKAYDDMVATVPWADLMGRSVHAKPVMKRFLRRYGLNIE